MRGIGGVLIQPTKNIPRSVEAPRSDPKPTRPQTRLKGKRLGDPLRGGPEGDQRDERKERRGYQGESPRAARCGDVRMSVHGGSLLKPIRAPSGASVG